MKNFSRRDRKFMQRCLALAGQGRGLVSPNPMVGCVIIKNKEIVSEGYHKAFGGPHAEVHALRDAGRRSRGATLYVNLEPCSHYGKTPPCVDAIIKSGIKKVVVASQDPNPLVAGQGIRKLRRAGIKVEVGLLREEAERFNEKFYTFMKTHRPFVGIKIAQTLDGRIADSFGRSKWITSEEARREGHRIRGDYDAILVGANTVRRDDPRLTVRSVKGRNPIRIVLDGRLTLAPRFKIFHTREARTIVLTSSQALRTKKRLAASLAKRGVSLLSVGKSVQLNPKSILQMLGLIGISSLLIEGGSGTISMFLQRKLVQRVHCFIAPKIFGGGVPSVSFGNSVSLRKSLQLTEPRIRIVGDDLLIEGSIKSL